MVAGVAGWFAEHAVRDVLESPEVAGDVVAFDLMAGGGASPEKFIGEGFDDPRLDTLFLTMPISWKGTLQQYVGRLHRHYHGKQVVQVYDYVDADEVILIGLY